MNRLNKRIIQNMVGTGFVGVTNIALIPLYINIIGIDSWSVVSIAVTLQAFFSIIDAGLVQLLSRNVAAESDRKNETYYSFYVLYAAIGVIIFLAAQLGIGYWAKLWLKVDSRSDVILVTSRIMLLHFLFQLINNVNNGFWQGIGLQKILNSRLIYFHLIRNVTFLVVVKYINYESSILYAFIFSIVSFFELYLNSKSVMRYVGLIDFYKVWNYLRVIKNDLAIITVAFIIGAIVSQIDRFALSRNLTRVEFAYFMATLSLALATLQIQYPITRALMPAIASKNVVGEISQKYIYLLCMASIMPSFFGIMASDPLCKLTIHSDVCPERILLNFRMLLIATCINGFANVALSKVVANGLLKHVMRVNIINLFIGMTIVVLLIRFGVLVSGFIWISTCTIQMTYYWILVRYEKE